MRNLQSIINGSIVFLSQSFTDLASAEAFFSNNLIGVPLLAGPNSVQIVFSETMSSAGGFSFDYAVASSGVSAVPGPIAGAGLPGLIVAAVAFSAGGAGSGRLPVLSQSPKPKIANMILERSPRGRGCLSLIAARRFKSSAEQ